MLCCNCKKKTATVFVAKNEDNKEETMGYCFVCARKLGLKPLNQLMDKIDEIALNEETVEALGEEINSLTEMAQEMIDENNSGEPDSDKTSGSSMPFFEGLLSKAFFSESKTDNKFKNENVRSDAKRNVKKNPRRKHLDNYCQNITEKALSKTLDRIIGRDKEINRVVQILSRRTKNNPCLIGEPGVGKTAIAEGLAIRIAEGNVPTRLKNKEIYLLDLTALVAGTQFRGQFESRIKGLVQEVKSHGNIILFIDEVHNLTGTGDSDHGSMSAANILKPALSRGEIQVIGATTFAEYRKYIEKDSALERRFQPVTVKEPSVESTVEVLIGIKDYFEKYHRVMLSDELIRKMVILSERYINDRFLPDKAIDLLDEACAYAALRNQDMEEYDQNLELIEKLKKREADITSQVNNINYEELAKIRSDVDKLYKKQQQLAPTALYSKVLESDVCRVIELWTGVPCDKIQQTELNKLDKLEEKLKEKIIGQDEAVRLVVSATQRCRVGISPRRRPASFIFVGPTGVGKTELAKVLAQQLFDSPETLIRLDMSEYMEKHAVSRIIGAPPGYVGYDESGQITEKVRRRPHSVLLFDEIEKAHPDVLNILLQILDEGRVTDSSGREVNFENTILIMTSNAGSDKKTGALGFAKSSSELSKEKAMKALSDLLRPEFLSRVDEVVAFKNLDESDFVSIADLLLKEYKETLAEKDIKLTYDEGALRCLAKKSIGGKSGARDLRNLIRRQIENKIASAIVKRSQDYVNIISLHCDPKDLEKVCVSVLA